jgi:uncharacterized protein (DUF697 family)
MSIDPRELAKRKFEEVIKGKKDKDEKADAIIWAAVTINAGLGFVPLGINIWAFLGVCAVMVTWLGTTYGYHLSHDEAAKLIRQIILSVGLSGAILTIGIKFFAEVLKGVGVFSLGGPTLVGMALDAVLCGGTTYAIGFTSKDYFKKNKQMTKDQMKQAFQSYFKEGKSKVKEARSVKESTIVNN